MTFVRPEDRPLTNRQREVLYHVAYGSVRHKVLTFGERHVTTYTLQAEQYRCDVTAIIGRLTRKRLVRSYLNYMRLASPIVTTKGIDELWGKAA